MENFKKILITGGTGFVGGYLCEELMRRGHYLTLLTRSPGNYSDKNSKNLVYKGWDSSLTGLVEEADVVINLAGENIFGKRWTDKVKKRIYDSRIEITRKLVDAMKEAETRPGLFISASGINYYKSKGSDPIDESDGSGEDFLAQVCIDWETEALKAENLGVRTAVARIAPVLEDGGGMVEKMKLPFLLFAGGPLGSGEQYVSWIHMHDLCNAIIYPMENSTLSGAYNATSPEPVTMKLFAKKMGTVLNRPAFFRVPEFVLKTVLGEGAGPVLASLRVQPKVLQVTGFEFEFKDLEEALADIL